MTNALIWQTIILGYCHFMYKTYFHRLNVSALLDLPPLHAAMFCNVLLGNWASSTKGFKGGIVGKQDYKSLLLTNFSRIIITAT